MYSFRNDYSEGAHPQVLQALTDTNLVQTCGYGVDPICEEARDLIRTVCAAPEADVHFLVGGTQTNLTVITALLASYEAVIAAHTGHVNCHETGAIEATGHKVCVETSPDGKVTPAMVEAVLARHDGSEHMVSPKMVYISDTTEIGTVYTKAELTALRHCCDEHGLLLFLDGARLGSALTSPESDLTLADLAALTDVFTIGGTKGIEILEKLTSEIREYWPDFEGFITVYYEGIFSTYQDKGVSGINLPDVDFYWKDGIIAPEFRRETLSMRDPLFEKCIIYDGGARRYEIHEHVEEVLDFWNKMLEKADRIDFTRLLEEKLGCPLGASYEEWIHINHYEEIDERVTKWLYRQEKGYIASLGDATLKEIAAERIEEFTAALRKYML